MDVERLIQSIDSLFELNTEFPQAQHNPASFPFVENQGLECLDRLSTFSTASLEDLKKAILIQLREYFQFGLLADLQTRSAQLITWRGKAYGVSGDGVRRALKGLPQHLTTTQVVRSRGLSFCNANPWLKISAPKDISWYALKPYLNTMYILGSDKPEPWAFGHIKHAHRLIHQAFDDYLLDTVALKL